MLHQIKSLSYESLYNEARMRKKGKNKPDIFSPQVKQEIRAVLDVPQPRREKADLQRLIIQLNVPSVKAA